MVFLEQYTDAIRLVLHVYVCVCKVRTFASPSNLISIINTIISVIACNCLTFVAFNRATRGGTHPRRVQRARVVRVSNILNKISSALLEKAIFPA